jgi:hypothetical protein
MSNRRIVGVLAALSSLALVLSSCSGQSSTPDSLGAIEYDNGGVAITVPALWAGTDPDGNPVGGVEPAEIFVSTSSPTSEYTVDLADIEAQGAGNAWRAATGMASAFATLFVSADPATVTLNFKVTGPIDGPSAGGILTVGLLAAFQQQSLQPGITMTGTITADGSIGPVGGVLTKIESAAREGFTTIVLPAALSKLGWEQGNDYTDLAQSLGVTLIPVHTIGEAYAAMTGMPVEETDLTPGPPLTNATAQVTESMTSSTIQRLAEEINSDQSILDPDIITWAQQRLDQAQFDLDSGNTAKAYGNSVFALTQLVRAIAAAEAEELIQTSGAVTARQVIRQRVEQALSESQSSLAKAAATPVRGLSQCFALPTALSWATFTQVTMAGILSSLDDNTDQITLIDFAQSVAEGELGVRFFLPQTLETVTSLDPGAQQDCNQNGIPEHLSFYSRFMVQAADSVNGYLENVLGTTLEESDANLKQDYTTGALAAEELADGVTPKVDSFSEEAQQLSTALTFYWLTSYAVSAKQSYAIAAGETPGQFNAMNQGAMDIVVDQSWWFTKFRSERLTDMGIDTGAAMWSARWALEQSLDNRDGPYPTESDWLALGELWYDAIQTTTMLSYLTPTTIGTT